MSVVQAALLCLMPVLVTPIWSDSVGPLATLEELAQNAPGIRRSAQTDSEFLLRLAARSHALCALENTKGSAVVTCRGQRVLNVPLASRKQIAENEYLEDRARLVANVLLVERQVRFENGICAPGAESQVELYTLGGGKKIFRSGETAPYLRGPSFTHPSGTWGVILEDNEGSEGEISGFVLIKSDGSLEERKLDQTLLSGELEARGGPLGELILSNFYEVSTNSKMLFALKIDRGGNATVSSVVK